jgi:hypothetical protein
MSNLRKGLVAAITLGVAAFAVPAASAQTLSGTPQTSAAAATAQSQPSDARAACSTGFVRQDAGVVTYKACTAGKRVRVTGSVNDTRHDGRCAFGKIRFSPLGQTRTYKDCGGAVTKFDTGWLRATGTHVTLR